MGASSRTCSGCAKIDPACNGFGVDDPKQSPDQEALMVFMCCVDELMVAGEGSRRIKENWVDWETRLGSLLAEDLKEIVRKVWQEAPLSCAEALRIRVEIKWQERLFTLTYCGMLKRMVARSSLARYASRHVKNDLFQEAFEHLLRRARSFNPRKGARLSTYAYNSLKGAISDHFWKNNLLAHLPIRLIRTVWLVAEDIEGTLKSSGTRPTPEQLANRLRRSPEEIEEALAILWAMDEGSGCRVDEALAILWPTHEESGRRVEVVDSGRAAQLQARRDEVRREIRECVDRLPAKQGEVVRLYYFDGMEPEQIAHKLGIKRNCVYQRLFNARRNLRRMLRGDDEKGIRRSNG